MPKGNASASTTKRNQLFCPIPAAPAIQSTVHIKPNFEDLENALVRHNQMKKSLWLGVAEDVLIRLTNPKYM